MKKVLIIRFSSIGDIILTTPVIRCLKQQLGDVEVHYVTKSSFDFLLRHNPYVDRIHTISGSVNEVADDLASLDFDFVIDLHNNIRSAVLKRKLGARSRSVVKLNIRKWIYVNFKWNVMPAVHIVDRYLEAAADMGVVNDGKGLDYFIDPDVELAPTQLPDSHANGFLVYGIGGQFDGKKMPVNKMVSLCSKLEQPIILLGGEEDKEAAEAIAEACGPRVIHFCGKLSMDRSAELVRQSRLVISHDTAVMHIGAAFKKNVISLWGQTVPEFGMYPYKPGEDSLIVEPNAKGRPVSKLGNKKQSTHIMEKIDEKVIIDHVNRIY